MKKFLTFLSVTFASTLFFPGAAEARPGVESSIRAMWVWNYNTAVATQDERKELLDFSKEHHINLLYVDTGTNLTAHPKEFSAFIREAHHDDMLVYALDGDSSWALTENQASALQSVQNVVNFDMNYKNTTFDGVEFDVEPYLLPHWWTNTQSIGSQYLDMLTQVSRITHKQGLKFDATIPFWYAIGDSPVNVDYAGSTKPLSFHVLDIVDSVSIMAYRNSANLQIAFSKTEIQYAGTIGKKVYVAAETSPADDNVGIPAYITYNSLGTKFMESQFALIDSNFQHDPGYGGIAIEHYDTYKAMSP